MMLEHDTLLKLKRWNTPTIYNAWEAITKAERLDVRTNREETRDFMVEMGPMIGRAITVVVQPSEKKWADDSARRWAEYRSYVASLPGPKIVVVQDLDSPASIIGSFWGEVNANQHRALGCVGTITDGAIRDVDEMTNAGFKALARRLCVGHAYSTPISWGEEVIVYGTRIKEGDLIHADKHGFMVIPEADQSRILEATIFMDNNECETTIGVARNSGGKSYEQIVKELNEASARFKANVTRFQDRG